MSIDLKTFGIDRLSLNDRLQLFEQIWDSLPEQAYSGEMPPWHLAELARRRAAVNTSPAAGRPWRGS